MAGEGDIVRRGLMSAREGPSSSRAAGDEPNRMREANGLAD
jgi:hypothetical protein